MPHQMKALSATGALGHEPIHPESFYEGIKSPLDFIGADAGSGDSGPYFLGSNEPMNPHITSWPCSTNGSRLRKVETRIISIKLMLAIPIILMRN